MNPVRGFHRGTSEACELLGSSEPLSSSSSHRHGALCWAEPGFGAKTG